jgi:hypothetical protein
MMSTSRPRLHKHVHAHEAVIATEYWYGDGPPRLHLSFSAAKTTNGRLRLSISYREPFSKPRPTGIGSCLDCSGS